MPRTLHDRFAKEWMQEFLQDFGTVQVEYEISNEVRHADIYFEPDAQWRLQVQMHPEESMGGFGRMITEPCLIEPYRNAISDYEICNCKTKSTLLGQKLDRQAKQAKLRFRFPDRPLTWMITPTLSKALQKRFCLVKNPRWGEGFYFLPEGDRGAVIVIHQLPVTLDTIWLRMLGRGTVQKRAIDELMTLPKDHPYRSLTLRHIAVLQQNLKSRQNISTDLQEIIMALSITYEQIEAELLHRGSTLEQRSIALNMLRENMSYETIARLTGMALPDVEQLAHDNPEAPEAKA
jgi:hypothetical protein